MSYANASLSVPSSSQCSNILQGSWLAKAPHAHQRPTPAALYRLHNEGLFIHKDHKRPPPVAWPSLTNSSLTSTPPSPREIPPPEWRSSQIYPGPTTTSTDKLCESGEHAQCSIAQFDVVRGDGGRPRLWYSGRRTSRRTQEGVFCFNFLMKT